jgi:haloalkane dehalogenase
MTGEISGLNFEGGAQLILSDEEKAAYDTPFPDGTYQSGALVFPLLYPRCPEDMDTINLFIKAWEVYDHWEKPF